MEQEVQKEKQRLSRYLHDNLGSQITLLSNNITQLERAEEEKRPVEKNLSQLKEGTGELMQTLRETIWILNKDKISCVELFDKVVSLAARHIEVCPPMKLHTEENISSNIELNSGQALQIFRICQEAINNTCKHAQATTLSIKANSRKNYFSISVSDNGKGFDLNENGIEGHYGLQNMQDRAKESNLDLNFQSSPGNGTSISVALGL
jgi:signal transduction histidine kinase